jgi:hypothetical protein
MSKKQQALASLLEALSAGVQNGTIGDFELRVQNGQPSYKQVGNPPVARPLPSAVVEPL